MDRVYVCEVPLSCPSTGGCVQFFLFFFLFKDLNNLCGTTERVQKAQYNKRVSAG